jgi:hypothetical protein
LPLAPQGFVIQALFAAPSGEFSVRALVVYSAAYYLLAALTYGAFIPSGLFTVRKRTGAWFDRPSAGVCHYHPAQGLPRQH